MKKSILLALTAPALLMAVACGGASNIDCIEDTLMKSSVANEEVAEVSVACKNCLVKDGEQGDDYHTSLYSKTNVGRPIKLLIKGTENYPLPEIPGDLNIIFKVGGTEISRSDYILERQPTGEIGLSYDKIQSTNPISIRIYNSTPCMKFLVDLKTDEPVEFNFNGALDYVDWGDNTKNTSTSHDFGDIGAYTVSVYGDLSSIWFTDLVEPTANTSLLKSGNQYINRVEINHTINSLPSYAFNGCNQLQDVYIGESVTNMGHKVFRLNTEKEGITSRIIYTPELVKPETWADDWTDCPVIYGSDDPVGVTPIRDVSTNLLFRLVNNANGEKEALITGFKGDRGTYEPLVIPVLVTDPETGADYFVRGIAPFAFYQNAVFLNTISEIKFQGAKIEEPSRFRGFGEYSFSPGSEHISNALTLNLSGLNITRLTELTNVPFKIGRGAFYKSCVNVIDFPKIPDNAPEMIIEDNAFAEFLGYSGLKINIPTNTYKLTTIGNRAFYKSSVDVFMDTQGSFPTTITSIGDEAFAENNNINVPNIILSNDVTHVGSKVFYNTPVESATVGFEERPDTWSEDWDIVKGKTPSEVRLNVTWGFVKVIDDSKNSGLIYHVFSKGGVKTATVVSYDHKVTGEPLSVTIPSMINDPDAPSTIYVVTEIAHDAFHNPDLISVIIPESVTKVGKYAFYGNHPDLKVFYRGNDTSGWDPEWTYMYEGGGGLDFGAGLYTNYQNVISSTSLKNTNFDVVKELSGSNVPILKYNAPETPEAVTVPATLEDDDGNIYNVTSIGDKAFHEVPEELMPGAGIDLSEGLTFAEGSNIASIGRAAFAWANLPTTLSFPSTVSTIKPWAFALTMGGDTIDLSNTNIKSLNDGTFLFAAGVKEVKLPDGMESIGSSMFGVFMNATSLTKVDLSKSNITTLPERLFFGCSSFSDVSLLPTGLISIGTSAFSSTAVTSVDLTQYSSLRNIGTDAFEGCQSLTSVKVPSSFESFGNGSFFECTNLNTIDLSQVNKVVTPHELFYTTYPTAFLQGDSGGKIIVPADLLESYKNSKDWHSAFKEVKGDYTNFFVTQ